MLDEKESLKDNCLLNGCTIEGVFYSPITNSCLYQKYSDNNNGHEIIIYLSLNEVGTNKVIKTYSAVANGEKSDKLMEFNEIVESYQWFFLISQIFFIVSFFIFLIALCPK